MESQVLVLSRKPNEEILIDDGRIIMKVLEIRGNKVRLGITAPSSVSVHRSEVAHAIAASAENGITAPAADIIDIEKH